MIRTNHRPQVDDLRARYADLRWRAATTGVALTQGRDHVGITYALASFDGRTDTFYSLDEVEQRLDQHGSALNPARSPSTHQVAPAGTPAQQRRDAASRSGLAALIRIANPCEQAERDLATAQLDELAVGVRQLLAVRRTTQHP